MKTIAERARELGIELHPGYTEPLCPAVFKSDWCRYRGPQTACDKKFATCCKLGNQANWMGDVPRLKKQ